MKKFAIVMVVLAAILLASSCTTFKASGLSYSMNAAQNTVLGNFETTVGVTKWLGTSGGSNVLNISSDATDEVIKKAIEKEIKKLGGTMAINVSIEYQASYFNGVLNVLTGYIYAPATLIIKGTVVK